MIKGKYSIIDRFIPTDMGNTSPIFVTIPAFSGSSPQTWGTHLQNHLIQRANRFIPTDMGNTNKPGAGK